MSGFQNKFKNQYEILPNQTSKINRITLAVALLLAS